MRTNPLYLACALSRTTPFLCKTTNGGYAHTDNKYKLFISAFQQMKNFLK